MDVRLNVFFRPRAKAIQTSYGQAENRQYDLTIECRISGILVKIIAQHNNTADTCDVCVYVCPRVCACLCVCMRVILKSNYSQY